MTTDLEGGVRRSPGHRRPDLGLSEAKTNEDF